MERFFDQTNLAPIFPQCRLHVIYSFVTKNIALRVNNKSYFVWYSYTPS